MTQQAVTIRRTTTIAESKTKTSVRTIPLADTVLAELAANLEDRRHGSEDLVVADRDGSPISQNVFARGGHEQCDERPCPPARAFTTSGTRAPAS